MEAFSPNQWLVLLLAFLLGLFLGMAFLASPKWKRRYREERDLRQEAERDRDAAVRDREKIEAERQHWEAQRIADRARDEPPPPA